MPVAQRWWGWGSLDAHFAMRDRPALGPFLTAQVGTASHPFDVPALEAMRMPTSGATRSILGDLSRFLRADQIRNDPLARLTHAVGKSYTDLMRIRMNALERAPDLVVFAEDGCQIAAVLALAEQAQWAVVPFGGGTSVTGGVEAPTGVSLCLDLERLSGIVELDEVSRLASFRAGTLGPDVEHALRGRGYTLGHYPQSFECSMLGGWIASRSSGQNSIGYGRIEDMLYGLKALAPRGSLEVWRAPATAAGPSLKELMLGSEGTLAVITEATVRVRPVPDASDYRAYFFHSFEEGVEAARTLLQEGPRPALARLSDAPETRAGLALSREPRGLLAAGFRSLGLRLVGMVGYVPENAALLLLGYEGRAERVAGDAKRARAVCRGLGAFDLGRGPAQDWLRDRFAHPYLRDVFLDRGIMVDTFETATRWSNLVELRRRLRNAALQALGSGYVMCHVSHAYETGASLYFTFLAVQDPDNPLGQWAQVKKAVSAEVMNAGGTLSHHHGVGRSHADWLEAELGPAGLEALRAVKTSLDPAGVLNPGVMWRVA